MRILCAALASDGFLLPTVAIARELQRRNHDVRFVSDISCAARLAEYGFTRTPRTARDGPSFGVASWFEPLHVAMQFVHLRYAAECFVPDVILSSQLALGPVAFAASRRISLVVIGPIVYLFPLTGDVPHADPEIARNAVWRLNDLRSVYHDACREIPLAPTDAQLFGDRYLLQGVPELDPAIAARLPAHVQQVGACLVEQAQPDMSGVVAWVGEQRSAGRNVAFVQLGRMFGIGDPWPVIARWAAVAGWALVASLERYDAGTSPQGDHVLVRNGLELRGILPFVDFAICSGTPSPLLAAAAAGKPVLIARAGSGTEEHAAAFERYGSGLAFDAAKLDDEQLALLVHRLLGDGSFARRACALQSAFAKVDGPSRAADEVERTAGVAA